MNNLITLVTEVYNAENNIGRFIEKAKLLTNDICVINLSSTDRTAEIANKLNATVITIPQEKPVERIRNLAFSKTSGEWIMILDADELMTNELASEIKSAIFDLRFTHYKIPRKNIFVGKKWLKYGGWYPDEQVRLIKREAFIDWPKKIHSTPEIKGQIGHLKSAFIHYFHPSLENMVKKTIEFESREAELLFKADRPVGIPTFFRKFLGELFRRLIRNLGFLDGAYGLIESLYQAYSKTITYLFLFEKKFSKKK